jgi:hypothetical protein
MYKDFPHKEGKIKTLHNIQDVATMEDMGRSNPRIYASLEDQLEEHQSHMIEVKGKISNHLVAILIYLGESHSYIDPKIVQRFNLKKRKIERSWLI